MKKRKRRKPRSNKQRPMSAYNTAINMFENIPASEAHFTQLESFLIQFPADRSESPWGDIVLDWSNGDKKLSVYILNDFANYTKTNGKSEVKHGVAYDLDGLRVLMRWLTMNNKDHI